MAYSVVAHFGVMQNVATFRSEDGSLRINERVVLRTDRGTELGVVLSIPEEIHQGQTELGFLGTVLRKMTHKDEERDAEIQNTIVPQEFSFCVKKIAEHNLPMKLVAVEHLLGGEKIIFYYRADGRVDFRQLVRDLAAEYRTRIEMRQIGVRDEARLLADYEHCGQEICCRRFIRNLEPVTMRMAKLQKTTLDPAKISGRCGRLMCCLRFEDESYAALRAALPRRGRRVRIAEGWGEVINGDTLRQTVQIHLDSGKDVVVPVAQILEQETSIAKHSAAPEHHPSADSTDAESQHASHIEETTDHQEFDETTAGSQDDQHPDTQEDPDHPHQLEEQN